MKKNNQLSQSELGELTDALHFMSVPALRSVCLRLELPSKGLKAALIARIMTYLKTGAVVTETEIPAFSKARSGAEYPLKPSTKILYGSYKNDLVTRLFFKKLIGEHFHFTAFGLDWIKERWMEENPPTYAEFADFWQQEHLARKQQKAQPKKEWALITFVQGYVQKHPDASGAEIRSAWKKERDKQVAYAHELLKKVIK